MTRHPWQAQADATRNTDISRAEVERILNDWYAGYRRFSRIDEDVFLALKNELIPLVPGEPVQFQGLRGHNRYRWLNGTFEGPVDNPDDENRNGDVWVTATASGQRVPVFLSSVRRRHEIRKD